MLELIDWLIELIEWLIDRSIGQETGVEVKEGGKGLGEDRGGGRDECKRRSRGRF